MEDYAILRHYSVNGHEKIAKCLVKEINLCTQWPIEDASNTIPYPQEKPQILTASDPNRSHSCLIS